MRKQGNDFRRFRKMYSSMSSCEITKQNTTWAETRLNCIKPENAGIERLRSKGQTIGDFSGKWRGEIPDQIPPYLTFRSESQIREEHHVNIFQVSRTKQLKGESKLKFEPKCKSSSLVKISPLAEAEVGSGFLDLTGTEILCGISENPVLCKIWCLQWKRNKLYIITKHLKNSCH